MSRLRIVTFKIEEDLLEEIDRIAREMGGSRSDVIRRALILYVSRVSKNPRAKRFRQRA